MVKQVKQSVQNDDRVKKALVIGGVAVVVLSQRRNIKSLTKEVDALKASSQELTQWAWAQTEWMNVTNEHIKTLFASVIETNSKA